MARQYIFNADAQKDFYKRLDNLHDKYVYLLLLNGVAEKGSDLESIKMTKNPNASLKYCKRVVGGLTNVKPQIIARLTEDGLIRLECIFTHIYDGKILNHLYMIQNVMDWPQIGKFSCQIWYLGETGLSQVEKIWNE